MKLYLIRHAPAELRHEFALSGQPDHLRPLTDKGIVRMHETLTNFSQKESAIDIVLQSPYLRCLQTAELLKEHFPETQCIETENLCPDHSAQKLYDEIQSYNVGSLAVIGHEPDLGQFLSWLLFRQATDKFPLKKGGIAKLDLYKNGLCKLKWVIHPKLFI